MSCDKCNDIHEAQRCGKTQEECKCKCHGKTITPDPYPLTNPWFDPCCPTIPWYDPCCPTYPQPYTPIWQVFPHQLPTCEHPFRIDTGTTTCGNTSYTRRDIHL